MKPILVSCRETVCMPAKQIADQILDTQKWPDFTGYGVLPGIGKAEFEKRTPEVVGSRIRVQNTDGSTHVEEIVEWKPESRLQLRLCEFAVPLSRMATCFDEIWEFDGDDHQTNVTRTLVIHGKSLLSRPALWVISRLLRGAITRHLRQIRDAATNAE